MFGLGAAFLRHLVILYDGIRTRKLPALVRPSADTQFLLITINNNHHHVRTSNARADGAKSKKEPTTADGIDGGGPPAHNNH